MAREHTSFASFWPYYLREHAGRRARNAFISASLGRMRFPLLDLADELARRLDDVDPLAALPLGQLTPPYRRVESAGEVDPRQFAVGAGGGEGNADNVKKSKINEST